jgi:uncharacterized OB-fold protein
VALDIYAYKCRRCGHLHYPYRMVCKSCRENEHNEFDPVPLPKKGRLLTFTRVYNLPADFEVASLLLGIVELENGMRMTAQIDVAEPKIGMKLTGEVKVVRREQYDAIHGMVFHAA